MRTSVRWVIAGLTGLLAATAWGQVELRSRTAPGSTIQGEHTFRIDVMTEAFIRVVECYVGDLLLTDTSRPYEFRIDTLEYDDGPLRLRFVAYTTENARGELTLEVIVNNEVGRGAEFHVERARAALTESKWDDAAYSARVALKAQPGFGPARIALARAYTGLRRFDEAERLIDQVVQGDGKNIEALNLLAGVRIQRAFATFARADGNEDSTRNQIREAFVQAVEARNRALSAELDALEPVTDANRLAYADAALRAGRYSLAVIALQETFNRDDRRTDVANRLVYAHLRNNRFVEAMDVLARHKRSAQLDAYGHALEAVLYAVLNDRTRSNASLREALLEDDANPGVRTARAYLALREGQTAVLGQVVTQLAEEPYRPEVQYYLVALNNRLNRTSEARTFLERGLLAEPVNVDLYVERTIELALLAVRNYATNPDLQRTTLLSAEVYADAAIAARPDSPYALAAKAMLLTMLGRHAEALDYADRATRSGPTTAIAHYAHGAVLSANRRATEGMDAVRRAGQFDTTLAGRTIPNPTQFWTYFDGPGRPPVLAPPSRS